ncbi:hypothetical protein, partial [Streptomyces sp. NPDC056821]|uniref:hypothetical protein n=1 Tax=unclassified Streptomyces TaxID=2593676 RepID=UPI0036AC3778
PPAQSATNPNEHFHSWASPTTREPRELDQALDHQDKVELLVLVESDTDPGNPLRSALLAAAGDGAALRLHRDVSHRLSRPLPASDADLINQLAAERTQLHRPW